MKSKNVKSKRTVKRRASPTACSAAPIDFDPGTVVINKWTGNVYTVIANYGDRAVAVRECSIMNADEWEVVRVPVKPNPEGLRTRHLVEGTQHPLVGRPDDLTKNGQ